MKRTVKISIKAHIFITAFFTVGKINPKINPTNAIVKITASKIVNAVMMFFLIVNNCLFVFDETNVCNIHNTMQIFNKF